MRAITVLQPWAQLIAVGAKRIETRSWKTWWRGPLAIHAGAHFSPAARALCKTEPFASALMGNENLPLGCIVAVCELRSIRATCEGGAMFGSITEWPEPELTFGDFSAGRFAWHLEKVRALEHPIPALGRQSLWTWDETALIQ